jgi:nonribosomal peptide synthetase DhbF
MDWMQCVYPLNASDRVLQKTPITFDASVWEFWAPLFAGATLVIAPPGAHRDPRELVDLVLQERITAAQFVPSLLALVLADGRFARCRSLRRVFCGGEPLPLDLVGRVVRYLGCELVNL